MYQNQTSRRQIRDRLSVVDKSSVGTFILYRSPTSLAHCDDLAPAPAPPPSVVMAIHVPTSICTAVTLLMT